MQRTPRRLFGLDPRILLLIVVAGAAVGVSAAVLRRTGRDEPAAAPAAEATASSVAATIDATAGRFFISNTLDAADRDLIQATVIGAAALTERATGQRLGPYTIFAAIAPAELDELIASDPQVSLIRRRDLVHSAETRDFAGLAAQRVVVLNLDDILDDGAVDLPYLTLVAAHEFVHVIQGRVSGTAHRSEPLWFVEGQAEYFGVEALRLADAAAADRERNHAIEEARSTTVSLAALVTRDAYDDERFPLLYPLGHLAVRQLVAQVGAEASLQVGNAPFANAFRRQFGKTLESFYEEFERERQASFAPYTSGLRVRFAGSSDRFLSRISLCSKAEEKRPCIGAIASHDGVAELRVRPGEAILLVTERSREGVQTYYYEDGNLFLAKSEHSGITIPEGKVIEIGLR